MLSNVLTYMIQIFVCTTGEEARMRWTLIDLSRFKKKAVVKQQKNYYSKTILNSFMRVNAIDMH